MNLQETFTQNWGVLYSQNSQVFSELYSDLKHYYRGSNLNLEEVLNEFWAKLMEKLFYQANKQYFIGKSSVIVLDQNDQKIKKRSQFQG